MAICDTLQMHTGPGVLSRVGLGADQRRRSGSDGPSG